MASHHSLPDRSRSAQGVLAFAAVYLIWGSTYLGIRYAIETIPPLLMTGVRFVIAGGVLYAVLRWRGAAAPAPRAWLEAVGVALLMLVVGQAGVAWSEQFVPSSLAALMVATVPLWVVVVDWLAPGGYRPSRRTVAGLLVGFGGIVVLVGPAELLLGVGGGIHPMGALVLVVASLSWALGSVLSRRGGNGHSPFLAAGMKMLLAGAVLLAVSAVSGEARDFDVAGVSAVSLGALLYLAILGSLVAFSAYIWLLQNAPVSKATTYAYVNPVIAVVLGWLVAGEPMSARILLAATVIVSAVVVITSEAGRGLGARLRALPGRREEIEAVPTVTGVRPERRCA